MNTSIRKRASEAEVVPVIPVDSLVRCKRLVLMLLIRKHRNIFLFLTDAFSLTSEIKFIQIIDPPYTMLSIVIKILRGTKRTPLVTCCELGICIILVLIASCKSFVFTRLDSLFIYFCISLSYFLHIKESNY